MEDTSSSPSPSPSCSSYGRVVRLHFKCRAPLPIGSSLRVTSSQLWAPGVLTPEDPNGARNVSMKAHETALPDNTQDGYGAGYQEEMSMASMDGYSQSVQQSYASSVEMVTSPDEWPVWRTRKPVIVSLRHHHGKIEQHRYRYLVVSPGANEDDDEDEEQAEAEEEEVAMEEEKEDDKADDSREKKSPSKIMGERGFKCATTCDEANYSTQVMMWEDPFKNRESQKELLRSTASIPSVRLNAMSKTLANLPYRTVEIDTETAKVKYSRMKQTTSTDDEMMADENGEAKAGDNDDYTSDDYVQLDTWHRASDSSFYPYLVREQINKANKAKKQHMVSRYNSFETSGHNGGGGYGLNSSMHVFDHDKDITAERMQSKVVSFGNLGEALPGDIVIPDDNPDMQSSATSLTATATASQNNTKSGSGGGRQRIFFACFHLPVVLTFDDQNNEWSATWSESLLAATEGSRIVRDYETHWIGTVNCKNHPITTQEERDDVSALLAGMDCTPVFLDKDVHDAHYLGMCKQVLWPAFHNVDLMDLKSSASIGINGNGHGSNKGNRDVNGSDWDQSRLDFWWEAYTKVNQMFGERLSTMVQPGDIMWVHDYHLSLLPKILDMRERAEYGGRSVTKKVFLLHIPFPTSMCFRELECGEEILKGMLHADVVGFHAFDHARHFLNATKRILGLKHENLVGGLIGIKIGRKTVLVTMHNVSIEPFQLEAAMSLPTVTEYSAKLRQDHTSRIIIAGVDIAQRLSGVSLKLMAFERLLTDYPIWQQKVVMVQKCLLPGSRLSDEAETIREVRQLVKRIQKKFGPNVIDYEEINGSSIPIDKRLALWRASHVLMLTPIREGLNLLPLEFVYTKKKPASPGVVIASEFSVVTSVLNGALRVNPFDVQMTVTSIDKALTMELLEKDGRRERDIAFVNSCSSSTWTKNVLNDLYDATAVTNGGDDNESEDTTIMATKFDKNNLITSTSAFLAYERELAFARLDITSVVNAHRCTKNRVLILDLNGTIILKEPPGKYLKRDILGSSGFGVNPEVSKALAILCSDPSNTVFVVSGDSQENVIKAIGDIPGLGLAASNGACFAPPLKIGETKRKWKYFDLGVDWDAVKKIVLPILAKYTARSNGSFVKLTHSSIGWSYYSCDPEWGSLQASHLVFELESALHAFDVRFVMIKGIVEVVPRRLNKGLIVREVLQQVEDGSGSDGIDFILCMGDDVQDEKMFTSVFSFISAQDEIHSTSTSIPITDENGRPVSNSVFATGDERESSRAMIEDEPKERSKDPLYAFTSVVCKKNSHAFTFVDDAKDVSTLLLRLAGLNDSTLSDEEMAGIEPAFR